jgi:ABC-type uncharacterized transport system involved in gliding motility auxiliary subunit
MAMNVRSQLGWLLGHLTAIFAILGSLALIGAVGAYLILGQFDRTIIVLLAVALGFWVYALLERPEKTVQALTSRNVRYGSNTVVMSVAFLGILALINVLGNRYSQQLDLTQNQIYTLSPLSVQIIGELKQPVHAIAFYRSGDPGLDSLQTLLKEYTRHSSQISYEVVDPQLKPGLARQYNVEFTGTTVLISGDKQQAITGNDEGAVTSALLKLERTQAEVAYYLTGHGEVDFITSTTDGATTAKTALEAQNYTVKSLDLATAGKVPADASLVVLAGPTQPLLPSEITALETYLDGGGKAIFLVDKRQRPILEPIAERYGVQIGNGVVIDPAQSYVNDPLTPIINQYQASPITKGLPEVLFQAATSIDPLTTPPTGVQVQPLAQTTDQSWLETDPQTIHFDPGVDPKGPLTVAASVTKPTADGKGETRLVWIGDVAFVTNGAMQVAPTNKALLTNAANWLTSNEDLIQVEAKQTTDQTLVLSNVQLNVLLYGSIFWALFVVGIGSVVWWRRR